MKTIKSSLKLAILLVGLVPVLSPVGAEGQGANSISSSTASPAATTTTQERDPFVRDQQGGGPDLQPPALWDLATGEQVAREDLMATKDFGAIVAGSGFEDFNDKTGNNKRKQKNRQVEAPMPVGVLPGDIILGVDGMRTYGWRDFQLASFRNPLSNAMTLLVNRSGDLQWVRLHDLPPGRQTNLQFDMRAEEDRFLDESESLGVSSADAQVRTALGLMPARAAAELKLWADANKNPTENDTAWLKEVVDLYAALQTRKYSAATSPAVRPPVAYFQRLEAFYLKLAAANQPTETAPDLKASGETPEFYTLALPVPDYTPPIGNLRFTDKRFQILVARLQSGGAERDRDIASAANKYAAMPADGLSRYLNQVKAAILDPDRYDDAPFRNDLVSQPVSVQLLQQNLAAEMKDPHAPDWALYSYANIILDFIGRQNAQPNQVGALLGELGKQSPYLARLATDSVLAKYIPVRPIRLNPYKTALAANEDFVGPEAPKLYRWALEKVAPQVIATGELDQWMLEKVGPQVIAVGDLGAQPLLDPEEVLTRAPYAELLALKQDPAPAAPTNRRAKNK